MKTGNDHFKRRCPRLGGPISFQYCRQCGDDHQPCWKIIDCWWEIFDIKDHLRTYLTTDQLNRLLRTQPKQKIGSLVELIAQAKNRTGCGR